MAQTTSAILLREHFEEDPTAHSTDSARDAFQEGVAKFQQSLTQDPNKKDRALKAQSIEAVREAVETAQITYEDKHRGSKTKERLRKFSGLLQYYGNVLDVMVQHHPEYVSLAWGAMKVVFTTFLNHEATISTLAKGLCKVGNTLPRIRLAVALYPTRRMKTAIADLYAYIIHFLIRAHDWYHENWLKHAWHSVTRPVELRYNDILEEIAIRTQIVHDLAVAGAQAEQRVMHEKLDAGDGKVVALEARVLELTALLISFKTMASGAFLDTNQRLTDLQMSDVLDYVAHVPLPDPSKALRFGVFMRGFRRTKHTLGIPDYAWVSPKLQAWSEQPDSSLITVGGTFRSRNDVKDLSTDLVELLQKSGTPVLWALKSTTQDSIDAQQPSAIDVLKYLTSQALRLSSAIPTEASASSVCVRFKTAKTANEWVGILASAISHLPAIYLIVDVQVLNPKFADVPASFWPLIFLNMFAELDKRGSKTVVKVALVSYGQTGIDLSCGPAHLSRFWVSNVRAPLRSSKPAFKRSGMARLGLNSKLFSAAQRQRVRAPLVRISS